MDKSTYSNNVRICFTGPSGTLRTSGQIITERTGEILQHLSFFSRKVPGWMMQGQTQIMSQGLTDMTGEKILAHWISGQQRLPRDLVLLVQAYILTNDHCYHWLSLSLLLLYTLIAQAFYFLLPSLNLILSTPYFIWVNLQQSDQLQYKKSKDCTKCTVLDLLNKPIEYLLIIEISYICHQKPW